MRTYQSAKKEGLGRNVTKRITKKKLHHSTTIKRKHFSKRSIRQKKAI